MWFVHYFFGLAGSRMAALDEGGAMKTGTVKWFNARKGYGFIQPVDGGFNVYIHINAVQSAGLVELKEGQQINFDTVVDEHTGQMIAENLSIPPNAPTTASVLVPMAGRKGIVVGARHRP
jgi:CspA family cold shock protein